MGKELVLTVTYQDTVLSADISVPTENEDKIIVQDLLMEVTAKVLLEKFDLSLEVVLEEQKAIFSMALKEDESINSTTEFSLTDIIFDSLADVVVDDNMDKINMEIGNAFDIWVLSQLEIEAYVK